MDRKTGYLASITNVPPLIFRFQFNPELLTEKKTFKYDPANSFGKWGFDQTAAASGLVASAVASTKDIKEIGSLLIGVKPLEPVEGTRGPSSSSSSSTRRRPARSTATTTTAAASSPTSPCSARSW